MNPKVYLETSFLSFLTARPSRDVIMAALIKQSREWWEAERNRFDLYASNLVVAEASAGDPSAAQRRLTILSQLKIIKANDAAEALTKVFLRRMALPANAADDALHIAIATTEQLDYLLTWNCRHIANAVMRPKVEALCVAEGYRCPTICTPAELRNIDL